MAAKQKLVADQRLFNQIDVLRDSIPHRVRKKKMKDDMEELFDLIKDYVPEEVPTGGVKRIVDNVELDTLIDLKKSFMDSRDGSMNKVKLRKILESLSPKLVFTDEEWRVIFMKMDVDNRGYCNWYDFNSYLLLEFKEKEMNQESEKFLQLEIPIKDRATVISSCHKHSVNDIIFHPFVKKDRTWDHTNGKYLTVSREGTINIWSMNLTLENTQVATIPSSLHQKTYITKLAMLPDINLLATSSTERDLRFFDVTSSNYQLKTMISGLPEPVISMCYHFHSDISRESTFVFGDIGGTVTVMKFPVVNGGPLKFFEPIYNQDYQHFKYLDLIYGAHQDKGITIFTYDRVHLDWVQQIKWFKELSCIVTCANSTKSAMLVLDPNRHKIRNKFSCYRGVNCICLIRETHQIVAGGFDCIIRVWNVFASKLPVASLHGHQAPIAALVEQYGGSRLFSLSRDKVLKVWDSKLRSCIMTVDGSFQDIGDAPIVSYYNPDYRTFIVAANKIAYLKVGSAINKFYTDGTTHPAAVIKALYNSKFKILVSVGMASNILLWNPWNGKRCNIIRNAHTKRIFGQMWPIGISAATLSPSQIYLLTGGVDGTLKIWNFITGTCMRNMNIEPGCAVTNVFWIPGRILACGWNKRITEWEDSLEVGDSKNWSSYHSEHIIASVLCWPTAVATASFRGELVLSHLQNGHHYKRIFVGNPELDVLGFASVMDKKDEDGSKSHVNLRNKGKKPCKCKKGCRCRCSICGMRNDEEVYVSEGDDHLDVVQKPTAKLIASDGCFCSTRGNKRKPLQSSKESIDTEDRDGYTGADRMEIHSLLFLDKREMAPDVGTLLVGLQTGWVQVWSHHPTGGLTNTFYAIHVIGDYVTCMTTDKHNVFLFTGHAFGYVKIWHIVNLGQPERNQQKRCMPILRLMFPFLLKDRILGRAKRAVKDQTEPLLVSSCRNHLTKVTWIELLEKNQVYVSCGLDRAARLWTYGGTYIGTLGGVVKWPEIKEDEIYQMTTYRVPPDLKRVVSSTSLKVLTNRFADQKKNQDAIERERRRRRSIEERTLKGKIYEQHMTLPILGEMFKMPDIDVSPKPPPKLNMKDPILRVVHLLKISDVDEVKRPTTPEFIQKDYETRAGEGEREDDDLDGDDDDILEPDDSKTLRIPRAVVSRTSTKKGADSSGVEPDDGVATAKKTMHFSMQSKKLQRFLKYVES